LFIHDRELPVDENESSETDIMILEDELEVILLSNNTIVGIKTSPRERKRVESILS
jgi:hypothetical protein